MNKKGFINLAKWGLGITALLTVFSALILLSPLIFAGDMTAVPYDSNSSLVLAPNSNRQLTFNVTNTDTTGNITQVNITLPSGFSFITDSNSTTANSDFSNTGDTLIWTNTSVFLLNASESANFVFNVSVPNIIGSYDFNVTTLFGDSSINSTNVTVNVSVDDIKVGNYTWARCGLTQWNCRGPGINMSAQDEFYYNGSNMLVVINYTANNSGNVAPISGLDVYGNFSQVGNSTPVYGEDLGNGLYRFNVTVNYTGLTVTDVQQVNITFNATNPLNTSVNTSVAQDPANQLSTALLVNMSGFGCPPASEQLPAIPGYWNGTGVNWTDTPIQADGCTTDTTFCEPFQSGQSEVPLIENSTGQKLICPPNFGPKTTSLNDVALNGNFSDVKLVLEATGQGMINFTSGVDFTNQQMIQGIMEFGMKSVMTGGRIGMNESEWDGTGGKPNLNISAELTLYNVTEQWGINAPYIQWGAYNGPQNPASLSTCTSDKCPSVTFDGENITFTVSSFSTFVAGNETHILNFTNLTSMSQTVVANQNATYLVNITNRGNLTGETTYNLSVVNTTAACNVASLNASWVTLNSTQYTSIGTSEVVELNVSHSTAGTCNYYIQARYWNGTGIDPDVAPLNSSDDGVYLNTTVETPTVTITNPSSNQNLTSTSGIQFNFTTNTNINTSECQVKLNGSVLVNVTCTNQTIGSGNFSEGLNQNLSIIGNDTYGNTNINDSVVFNIDNTAPESVSITLPAANANVSGTLRVNATATDTGTGVDTIKFNLSNSTGSVVNVTTLSAYGQAGNYTGTVSTSSFSDGNYNITLIVSDFAGNSNSSQSINITIDNSAPAVTINTPTAGYKRLNITINATVTDNDTNVDTVQYNLTNSSGSVSLVTLSATGNDYNATLDTTTLADGNYTITIIANNTAGVTNNTESVTITVDNTAPGLSSWNYSFITQQLTLKFNETVNVSTISLGDFDITWNNGEVALNGLTGTPGATVDTSSNSDTIVVNFSTTQDNTMRDLRSLQDSAEGEIDMAAGAIKDLAGNNVSAASDLGYTSYNLYGVEIDLTTAEWNSFNLPRTVLEDLSSLGGNYTVANVLSSISGNYDMVFYYNTTDWTSYKPGRATNDFTQFTADDDTHTYWINMTTADKLQIE